MFSWIIGIPLLSLFATIALAFVVIPSTRGEPSRPTLNSLLLLIALWTFGSVMIHSTPFPSTLLWMYIILLPGMFVGAVGVHFSVQFGGYHGWKVKWLARIFYVLPVILSYLLLSGKLLEGATLLPDGTVDVQWGPMSPVLWAGVGCGILLAIGFLLSSFLRSSQSDKKRTIFPLLGYLFMCLGTLSNSVNSSYPIDIASNFVFVGMISYGVVSTRMLRPAIRLSWHLMTLLAVFLLMLCYIAVWIFCREWLGYTLISTSIIAGLITLTFGVVVFGPTRRSLLKILKSWLFPETYRYQQALSSLAMLDSSLLKRDSSATNALDIIVRATSANGAVLLQRNEKTGYFEATHSSGKDVVNLLQIKLPIDSPLVTYMDKHDSFLTDEEIEQRFNARVVVRGEDDILIELGSTLYCPIQGYDGLLAILAIVRGSHAGWYGDEAKDFLKLACHQISTNTINAKLYQTTKLEIEERKQMEEELRVSREQLINFSRYLQSAREEERMSIAREIHDELGQALTALKMDLSWMDKRLPEEQEALHEKTGAMSELISTTIKAVRRISTQLRPGVLDDLGLIAAIEWQTKEFQERTGIKCKFDTEVEDIVPDRDLATAVFRILQETLTNIARHANATEVRVSLRQKAGNLVLRVADNGVGIKEAQITAPGSFGLIGIRERARYKGGNVEISGVQGEGTTVTVSVPLDGKGETK